MLIESMKSPNGNTVPNQFILLIDNIQYFQSYKSMIARKNLTTGTVTLDTIYWDYSRTTSKYLSLFLNEPIKDIRSKVKQGTYQLVNLN